jgi:hypothetical protein
MHYIKGSVSYFKGKSIPFNNWLNFAVVTPMHGIPKFRVYGPYKVPLENPCIPLIPPPVPPYIPMNTPYHSLCGVPPPFNNNKKYGVFAIQPYDLRIPHPRCMHFSRYSYLADPTWHVQMDIRDNIVFIYNFFIIFWRGLGFRVR